MIRSCKKFMYLLTIALIIFQTNAAGQSYADFNKYTDFLPPPPNAAAIAKYGFLSINKNTGTPNVSLPLFTLKGRKLSSSVSLGYSSSGIKVDDIASRVGMGWVINAGGVINRTVRGQPDELRTRLLPWATIGTNYSTLNFMDAIMLSDYTHGYDGEPDLFTFNCNGHSGSFVFDNTMSVVLIEHSKIKIEYNFSSTDWNFKITTTDGVVYYFGGSTATEKTKRLSTCGKSYDTYLANSWYLKKIEHANGEVINFVYTSHTYEYETGIAQTMYYMGAGTGISCSGSSVCGTPPTSTCVNTVSTQGVLLQEINSPSGNNAIKFFYQTRQDCGDKLISRIEWADITGQNYYLTGAYDFSYTTVSSSLTYANQTNSGYDKTPYLTTLTEKNSSDQSYRTWKFIYNDYSGRPPRLSYSQDHWGYFNGKINSSFTPAPENSVWQSWFPSAVANKEPDFNYAVKGILTKVVYPTGGVDSLVYEPNQVYKTESLRSRHDLYCSSTGTGFNTQVTKTIAFYISQGQEVNLYMQCIDNSGNGSFDPLHNKGTIEIVNSSNSTVFSQLMTPGNNYQAYPNLTAGNYTLKMIANGSVVTSKATLKFYPTTSSVSTNQIAGGIRIRNIITGNAGEKPLIKRYFYGELNSLNQSSLYNIPTPVYYKATYTFRWCGLNSWVEFCPANYLYSSSLGNLFDYQSSPVSYSSVVESIGENFEGGGTQTKYLAGADAEGQVLYGEFFFNAPKTNFGSMLNAKIKEENILKKSSNGALYPIKTTKYTYKIDNRGSKTVYGYVGNARWGYSGVSPTYDTTCSTSQCNTSLTSILNSYDLMRYEVMRNWIYVDTLTEIVYDEKGQNPMTNSTVYNYENDQHLELTRTETYNSKGELLKTQNQYPHDYSGQAPYNDMITKNIITPVVDVKSLIETTQLSETKINFANWGYGNYSPSSVQKSTRSNLLETEGTIDQVDAFGNIQQFTGKDGVVTAILWGYNYIYPVAKVTNATYSQAISYVSGGINAIQSLDGSSLRNALNPIRTNLGSAQVTTYTYKHLVGVTSITDLNDKTNTYEYDAYGRLQHIKDQDGNIVKKAEYSYATPDANPLLNLYFNTAALGYFSCQPCQNGFMGVSFPYTVNAGKYFSLISQADADAKAQADLAANGQAYANKYGWCSTLDADAACAGPSKKRIGCLCETGFKVYTSSYQNQDGTWTCTYHYHWSDNTNSQNYTEITSYNCWMEE